MWYYWDCAGGTIMPLSKNKATTTQSRTIWFVCCMPFFAVSSKSRDYYTCVEKASAAVVRLAPLVLSPP